MRRLLSHEEHKVTSDLTQKSREENSGTFQNTERSIRNVKVSRVLKKGILLYNERILTLTSAPKLSYLSNGTEKAIELNSRTKVKQLGESYFEVITNKPVTKFRFKTFSAADCEEWVVLLQKIVQNFLSE